MAESWLEELTAKLLDWHTQLRNRGKTCSRLSIASALDTLHCLSKILPIPAESSLTPEGLVRLAWKLGGPETHVLLYPADGSYHYLRLYPEGPVGENTNKFRTILDMLMRARDQSESTTRGTPDNELVVTPTG